MDDLSEEAEKALDGRRGEVDGARAIVQQEVEKYRADERARGAAPIVSALRNRVSSSGKPSSRSTGPGWASSTRASGGRWSRWWPTSWPRFSTNRRWL